MTLRPRVSAALVMASPRHTCTHVRRQCSCVRHIVCTRVSAHDGVCTDATRVQLRVTPHRLLPCTERQRILDTPATMSHLMTPQQSKDTEESLMRLTVAQLKQRCAALGTPVTGTKPKLVSMILDPASHQRKKAAAGCGIKKKKKEAPKSLSAFAVASYMSALSGHGMYGYGMYGEEVTRAKHTQETGLLSSLVPSRARRRTRRRVGTARPATSSFRRRSSTWACACTARTRRTSTPSLTACARAA